MKLFAFYIGGETATSNIELHDMRFAVGESMEACHDELRRQWWGTPESLHIDCQGELTVADGYAVALRPEPFAGPERLFFANLGGYDPEQFTELHSNIFVVAADKMAATKRGLATIRHWKMFHRDTLFEVEHIINLDEIAAAHGLHIHLAPAPDAARFSFTCRYLKIGTQRHGSRDEG